MHSSSKNFQDRSRNNTYLHNSNTHKKKLLQTFRCDDYFFFCTSTLLLLHQTFFELSRHGLFLGLQENEKEYFYQVLPTNFLKRPLYKIKIHSYKYYIHTQQEGAIAIGSVKLCISSRSLLRKMEFMQDENVPVKCSKICYILGIQKVVYFSP